MLRKRFPLIVSVILAFASGSYALAQSTSTSDSTATTAQQDSTSKGMVPFAFKLNLDHDSMTKVLTMMHAGRNRCVVEDLNPGDDSSAIVICGIEPATETFHP
ncbi:MAG TPA: hypothetical protein VNC39_05585 [Acidocella sp.]|jgi:hypothetical protein|uniref:hypothetical protein n=1 Tax=Acidocella sp. TaxID=50710 RepID=UPI002BA718E1|nr:hypothetical protein [Acidocella sp.]HVE21428.1 hypothetical protein [Acidocella sp.]